jgi:hypothetical protein
MPKYIPIFHHFHTKKTAPELNPGRSLLVGIT